MKEVEMFFELLAISCIVGLCGGGIYRGVEAFLENRAWAEKVKQEQELELHYKHDLAVE